MSNQEQTHSPSDSVCYACHFSFRLKLLELMIHYYHNKDLALRLALKESDWGELGNGAGLIAQLLEEHFIGTAKVGVQVPFRPQFFMSSLATA